MRSQVLHRAAQGSPSDDLQCVPQSAVLARTLIMTQTCDIFRALDDALQKCVHVHLL